MEGSRDWLGGTSCARTVSPLGGVPTGLYRASMLPVLLL